MLLLSTLLVAMVLWIELRDRVGLYSTRLAKIFFYNEIPPPKKKRKKEGCKLFNLLLHT